MTEKEIYKIVITGGPCAGKTTAMEYIQSYFKEKGFTVIVVPETATELILGGIAPWTCKTVLDYQLCQAKLQMEKERIFMEGVNVLKEDKVLMICDRGLMDNRAYMEEADFQELLKILGLTEWDMLDPYEAVFHLETVAKESLELYSLDNNGARFETAEEAVEMDDRLVRAWSKHPKHFVIHSCAEVESKLKYLAEQIEKNVI